MKKQQFLAVILIVVMTIWFSWAVLEFMTFAYNDYNQTDTYAVINTLKYLRLSITIFIFLIAGVYSIIIALLLKLLFRDFKISLIIQLGSLVFLWVFSNGIIGSYEGIREYQLRKCNLNIEKCLEEERSYYSK